MPPIDPSILTVLNMRFCPYAQRTLLCLNAKGIDYQTVNCALMTKPEWLWDLNPIGKVPVLLHKDVTLYESIVTSDFVDSEYPGRMLHSKDPVRRARDHMLVELFNKVLMPQMKIWFGWKIGQGPEHRAKHFSDSMDNMKHFEMELKTRGTPYFGGDLAPGWLDYMLWPWYERVNIYGLVYQGEEGLKFDGTHLPLLCSWIERMREDTAVQEYLLEDQVHADFVRSIASGSPNYDLIVDQ